MYKTIGKRKQAIRDRVCKAGKSKPIEKREFKPAVIRRREGQPDARI